MTGKTAHKPQAKIIVAAHKPYPMPCDPLYLPLFVGAEGRTDAMVTGAGVSTASGIPTYPSPTTERLASPLRSLS